MSEKNPLVCAVGSSPAPKHLYAIGAEFANPMELYAAAEKVRDKGYKWWDCYTPYYIHGLDKAMGLKKSMVGLFTFVGGLSGLVGVFLLITITSVYVYPMDTQGKPFFSLPGFVPIMDLLMILLSAIMNGRISPAPLTTNSSSSSRPTTRASAKKARSTSSVKSAALISP
jgi:hypothetical protein